MMDIALAIAAMLIGLCSLAWGADRFVTGAAATARHKRVSPLLVGITIVALGTSAPEVVVSILASIKGNGGLAVGNALGSNIANIGLVLGGTALFRSMTIRSSTLTCEIPILLIVTLITTALLSNHYLGRWDGVILVSLLLSFLGWLFYSGLKQQNDDLMLAEYQAEIPSDMPLKRSIIWFVIGLVLVLVGAKVLVESAVFLAKAAGISDLVIGLTIIAIGTSLPELATSIASVTRGEHDIAVGNVIGSNIFNLVAVLAIPALLDPETYPQEVFFRDGLTMCGFTLLLVLFAFRPYKAANINRWEGLLFLMSYIAYLSYLAVR